MVIKAMLYTDRNQLKGFDDELIRRFHNKDLAILTFETVDTATPADETTSLAYTATANVAGTTTPVRVKLTASNAKDTLTGVGVEYVHIMGLKAVSSAVPGAGIPHVSKSPTKGTNTDSVYDENYWVRVWGMRPAAAGTDGDAAGKILLTDSSGTIYATITAAGCMSSVGHLYVPAGWAACVFRADWSQNQACTATAHAFYSARYVGFEDEYYSTAGAAVNITRDRFAIGMANGASGTVRLRQIPLRANSSTASSYISFHGDLITGTLTGSVKFYVLMVKL